MSRNRKSPIWSIDRETLKELVETADTITDILNCFGLPNRGSNYVTLKRRLLAEGIPYPFEAARRGRKKCHKANTIPIEEILVKPTPYRGSGSNLKKRLFAEGLLEDACAVCGQEPLWMGKPLALEIDHINGDNTDNRIENLQIICPHCHSQTETFRGRKKKLNKLDPKQVEHNIKKFLREESNVEKEYSLSSFVYKCLNCDKFFEPVVNTQKYCSVECASFSSRRAEWPSKEELQGLIYEKPFTKIGRDFGVSDNTIRKWCRGYGIELPKFCKGYWAKKKAGKI